MISNPRIVAEFRLETSNPKVCGDSGNRVWVDITVDGTPVQGSVIYSGELELARAIIAREVIIQKDGVLMEVATGEPHPRCHVTAFNRREARRIKEHQSQKV